MVSTKEEHVTTKALPSPESLKRSGVTLDDATPILRAYVLGELIPSEAGFWIETEHGSKIDGPFTTGDDANKARVWAEKVFAPETFWIRDRR